MRPYDRDPIARAQQIEHLKSWIDTCRKYESSLQRRLDAIKSVQTVEKSEKTLAEIKDLEKRIKHWGDELAQAETELAKI